MSPQEFSNQFDVLYNNITSNQAAGLTEYEKSLFLTKGQDELVKNYFLQQSNPKQAGYDDNQKRQADFSCLMKVASCSPSSISGSSKFICMDSSYNTREFEGDYYKFFDGTTPYTLNAGSYVIADTDTITVSSNSITVSPSLPYATGTLVKTNAGSGDSIKIDERSTVYEFPSDVFLAINESAKTNDRLLQVIPLRYDDYIRLMSKPFKRPLKNQAWRLINNGDATGNNAVKYVELIAGPNEHISSYTVRYIRRPKPIIVGDLDGLTINGYYMSGGTSVPGAEPTDGVCELDPMLHEEILQRAVELAKVAWTATGQDNAQIVIQSGQRSE